MPRSHNLVVRVPGRSFLEKTFTKKISSKHVPRGLPVQRKGRAPFQTSRPLKIRLSAFLFLKMTFLNGIQVSGVLFFKPLFRILFHGNRHPVFIAGRFGSNICCTGICNSFLNFKNNRIHNEENRGENKTPKKQ